MALWEYEIKEEFLEVTVIFEGKQYYLDYMKLQEKVGKVYHSFQENYLMFKFTVGSDMTLQPGKKNQLLACIDLYTLKQGQEVEGAVERYSFVDCLE